MKNKSILFAGILVAFFICSTQFSGISEKWKRTPDSQSQYDVMKQLPAKHRLHQRRVPVQKPFVEII